MGRFQLLERRLLPNYQFGPTDIVVTIGQDGLVANTLKYLEGQPVIAINPDPGRWDGKLLPFEIGELQSAVTKTIAGKSACKTITFAEAKTNDGQRILAVNDLFVGPKSHTSARYLLSWNGREETQSSSGIIISTGFGSTGWFQSILAGALGVSGSESHPLKKGFAWHEQRLQFTVREPFPSLTTGTSLVFGAITLATPLKLESQMPENGVIFSDGIETDYLAFNSGTVVTISLAATQGQLIV
ncbi:sugar kinase [Methylomonas sp. CM2]|uniref:sugar kinase n=1 Tax=Methylomonas sp. CM2 TaxID=3417647 RepID=UPI003CF362E9